MKVRHIELMMTLMKPSPFYPCYTDGLQGDPVRCVNKIHGGALGSLSKFFVVFKRISRIL